VDHFDFSSCKGFQWDAGNSGKNWLKHKVLRSECEQTFFNHPVVVNLDLEHSSDENRFYLLGQTDRGRLLFIVFTIRCDLIRVVSARDMSKKERGVYKNA
jgi:uncharacterized DUF497 family protein